MALDCDTIKDLIPKAGPRIKFFTKLKQQRDLMNIPVLLAADVNTENVSKSSGVALLRIKQTKVVLHNYVKYTVLII